jgi:hypothetical protein
MSSGESKIPDAEETERVDDNAADDEELEKQSLVWSWRQSLSSAAVEAGVSAFALPVVGIDR